ncbi:MAG: hypothetical protein IJB65_07160 [Clostridia bacterium]|nr:hypothetical protein [Clostridia bacterium]
MFKSEPIGEAYTSSRDVVFALSLMSKVQRFLKSKTVEMSEKVYEKCLGAYSVIQLAIAILGCVFVLAVMTLPRSLDS